VIRARFGKTAAGRLLLGAGALALLMPAIAGCEAGNGAPTLEFHAASAGAQTVVNGIRITNVFVLGAPSGASLPVTVRAIAAIGARALSRISSNSSSASDCITIAPPAPIAPVGSRCAARESGYPPRSPQCWFSRS